jgi:hypothetical protein
MSDLKVFSAKVRMAGYATAEAGRAETLGETDES